jgi:hypothetical protein
VRIPRPANGFAGREEGLATLDIVETVNFQELSLFAIHRLFTA